jgi:hypothetical protein
VTIHEQKYGRGPNGFASSPYRNAWCEKSLFAVFVLPKGGTELQLDAAANQSNCRYCESSSADGGLGTEKVDAFDRYMPLYFQGLAAALKNRNSTLFILLKRQWLLMLDYLCFKRVDWAEHLVEVRETISQLRRTRHGKQYL